MTDRPDIDIQLLCSKCSLKAVGRQTGQSRHLLTCGHYIIFGLLAVDGEVKCNRLTAPMIDAESGQILAETGDTINHDDYLHYRELGWTQ